MTDIYGQKLVDIPNEKRSLYWNIVINNDGFSIELFLANYVSENYYGWVITDDKGCIYLARNGKANINQKLVFNHLHKFHE